MRQKYKSLKKTKFYFTNFGKNFILQTIFDYLKVDHTILSFYNIES